jgi:predicted nucleic acid-binding protein
MPPRTSPGSEPAGSVVADPDAGLREAIAPGASILVDTSVVLAYIGGGEPISDLARTLFDAFASTGRNPTALSTVTVAELLVRPFRRSAASVATAEGFLRHFGDLRLVDATYEVAREAARIRAVTDLPMPDSLIVASAVVADIGVVVTNDRDWPARLTPVLPDLRIVVLSSFIA